MSGAAKRQKSYYDQNSETSSYDVNSLVWRYYPPTANTKLGKNWVGPYKIVAKLSDIVYTLQKSPFDKAIQVNVDHLKPYKGTNAGALWSDCTDTNDYTPSNSVETVHDSFSEGAASFSEIDEDALAVAR